MHEIYEIYPEPRTMALGHIPPRRSILTGRGGQSETVKCERDQIVGTLHEAMKAFARSTSTPDQSFSMLLMAKAQYTVRRSDSVPCGVVRKLR